MTGHYTYGDGYYQNYKNDQKLKKYNLPPIDVAGIEVSKTNLIRRKSMNNDFGGIVASANYTTGHLSLSMGASWNMYDGEHWGRVLGMEKVPDFPKPNITAMPRPRTTPTSSPKSTGRWRAA